MTIFIIKGDRCAMRFRSVLRTAVLAYAAFSFYEPFWRLTVRGAMEPNFQWEYAGIGGTGMSGDYWMLTCAVMFGMVLLYAGWRGRGRAHAWFMLAWMLLLFASSSAIVLADPATKLVLDTLHLELPYVWVIFPLDLVFFILTAVWVFQSRQRTAPAQPPWNRTNTVLLLLAVILLPVEYMLFNSGEQHGMADGAGVAVTFVQWVLLNLSFIPWNYTRRVSSWLRVQKSLSNDR